MSRVQCLQIAAYLTILTILAPILLHSCGTNLPRSVSETGASPEERALFAGSQPFVPAPDRGDTADGAMLASEAKRRAHAWALFQQLTTAVPVPGLPGTRVPAVQFWYSLDEVGRLLPSFYASLSRAEQVARKPTDAQKAVDFLTKAATDPAVGGFTADRVRALSQVLAVDPSSTGIGQESVDIVQVLFSPAFAAHVLANFGKLGDCTDRYVERLPSDPSRAPDPVNFAPCLDAEFPKAAAMVKMRWAPTGTQLQVYQSDAASLKAQIQNTTWSPVAMIAVDSIGADRIHTIRVATTGQVYRLKAMHIATKEHREWFWSTFWWSDRPSEDFGADRPTSLLANGADWGHYKMCVAQGFDQGDPDPGRTFRQSAPTLAAALDAVQAVMGTSSWCSNPYVEQNFAKTNCVACHQKAPVNSMPILTRTRSNYPSDFVFSERRFRAVIGDLPPPAPTAE